MIAAINPKISVRTVGPTTWTVALSNLGDAENVHRQLSSEGMSCSDIECRDASFEFVATAAHLLCRGFGSL